MKVIAAIALVLLATAGTVTHSTQAVSRSTPTRNVSPVAQATWFAVGRDAVDELELLVLWRGTPGRFMQSGGTGGGNRGWRHDVWITRGPIRLTLEFDSAERVATVQGQRVELGDDNVVFVDDVDSADGPRVTGTMRIPSALPGPAGQIGVVLRASPAIVSFLRCDARRADGRGDAYLVQLCPQVLGVSDGGQVVAGEAPQSGSLLSSLTVPATVLREACRIQPVPATGASIADVGHTRILTTRGSLWRVPDNPWVGDDPGILVQLRKRIDGGYALPLSPPPTAAERAEVDRGYVEHVVRGYQALYESGEGRVVAHVRAIEFDDPGLVTGRPGDGVAGAGSVRLVRDATVVLITGETGTECRRRVEAHVREHLAGGARLPAIMN